METPDSKDVCQPAASSTRLIEGAAHGEHIGPYKILESLGQGGMGVVYLAEQTEPVRRRVALKVIKPGMDSQAVLARFDSERQALALMNHPNVAKVFDAGATDQGRPYFVLEFVHGVPITEHCDRHKLSIGERLNLFTRVCEAVQHAHQKGIIHRDIKPGNILVEYTDGEATPKIIDFGVAKAISQRLTEKTLFTEQGMMIGTPAYMSPEQADLSAQDVDTRTDIYSLGVLLYELLTGSLPFDPQFLRRAGFVEMQRIIREVEPPKPSTRVGSAVRTADSEPFAAGSEHVGSAVRTGSGAGPHSGPYQSSEPGAPATGLTTPRLRSGLGSAVDVAGTRRADPKTLARYLRGDLDWITMKALEKDRARRYASALDLAADIRRHLLHQPVVASPPSAAYRVTKFVRRNRGVVTAVAVIFAVLIAGMAGTAIALRDAIRARALAEDRQREAETQRAEAERQTAIARAINDFLNDDLLAAVAPEEQGRDVTVREVLDTASEVIEGKFAAEPLVEASIRLTLANTYWRLGEYQSAVQHAKEAFRIRRAELGKDHPDTLDSMNSLAVLYKYQGRYDMAEPLYLETLETRRRVLGDEHPNTLESMNNLAVLLRSQGKLDEAEALHREALSILRRARGDEDPLTLNSMANLAVLLWEKGELDEAERLARKAMETRLRVLPEDHPDTLQSMYSLAVVLAGRDDPDEAERLYRRTLQMARRVFGDEHPRVAIVLNDLAQLLQAKGEYAAAETVFREALDMLTELLRDEHWETGDTRSNLGECLAKLGRYEEAEQELLAAHRTLEFAVGATHWGTIKVVDRLGSLYDTWGKPEKAAAWREQLKRIDSRALPSNRNQ